MSLSKLVEDLRKLGAKKRLDDNWPDNFSRMTVERLIELDKEYADAATMPAFLFKVVQPKSLEPSVAIVWDEGSLEFYTMGDVNEARRLIKRGYNNRQKA